MSTDSLAKKRIKQEAHKPLQRLDFNSDFFDSTMAFYMGKDIAKKARKLKQSPDFQNKLQKNFTLADQAADRLVESMMKDKKIRTDYEIAIKKGLDSIEAPCQELQDFINSAQNIPDFIDRDKVEIGGQVFRSKLDIPGMLMFGLPITIYQQGFVPTISLMILFSNKPDSPSSISKTLSAKAGKKRGSVRLLETFKWFNKVAEPGSGALYSEAFAENCRIHIVHGYVRRAVNANKTNWNYVPEVKWQDDILGTPLSAADGSIVVSTLLVTLYAMKRHLKKNLSYDELDALNHWANYLSYLQGVPEELLFPTFEETLTYFSAFMMSINTNVYHTAIAAFIEQLQDLNFEKFVARKSKPVQLFLDGLTRATLNDKFDSRIRSHYGINPAPIWAKGMLWAAKRGISVANTASKYSPKISNAIDKQTEYFWSELMPGIEEAVSSYYGSFIGNKTSA